MDDLYRELSRRIADEEPCATATIVAARGSVPNGVGATLLADAGGHLLAGTVGGGEIEHRTLAACAEAIAEGNHRRFVAHLTDAAAGGIGMMCGGKVEVFIQVHLPAPHLVLVGAGHINRDLARLARPLGYRMTVIDDRPEWCDPGAFPGARCVRAPAEEGIAATPLSGQTYVVIATHNRDAPALEAALETPARYVGVVASRRKAIVLLRRLAERGVDLAAARDRLHLPVGLALGGRGPVDIALGILAEIHLLRRGGQAAHLRVDPTEIAPRNAGRRDAPDDQREAG